MITWPHSLTTAMAIEMEIAFFNVEFTYDIARVARLTAAAD